MKEKPEYHTGDEQPPRGWEFPVWAKEPWPDLPGDLQHRILIAIGQASVCWDSDGVFDTDQAIETAKNLAWQIDQAYSGEEQA